MPDPRSRALPVFQLDITFLSNDPILDDIRRLGGQVVPATRYHPAATHLILKSQGENKLRIPILASIAGGKWVIKEEYIEDSMKANYFLDERDYLAECAKNSFKFLSRKRLDRLFWNWDVILVINSQKIQDIRVVLEAGGAKVCAKTPKDLNQLSTSSLHRITHLFSQPLYLKDKEFNYFWLNNNDRFGISVYSFFYIYKFIKDPSDNAQANLQFFRLDNPKLREVLHTPERDEQVENRSKSRQSIRKMRRINAAGTSEPELIVLDEPSSTAKISNRGTLSKNKRAPEITLDEDEVKSKKYKPEIIEILDDDNHRNGKQSNPVPPVIGLDSDDEIQIAAIPRKRNQLRGVGGLRQINRTKRRTNIGTPLPGAAATSSSSSAPGRPPTPDCVYMPSGRTKDDSRQPQTQSQGSFIDLVSSDEEVEDVKPVITRLMLAQQKNPDKKPILIDHEYMTISLSSDDELLEEDTDDDNEEIVLLESKGKDALVDEEKRKKEEEEAKEKEEAEKLAQTKAEEEERKRKEEKRKKEEEEKEKERRETELKELEGLTRAANEDSPVSKQQGQILVDLQKDVDKLSHSQAQGFVRSEPDQSKIGTDQEKPLIHVKKEGLFPPAVGTPTAASPAVADADVIVLISSDEDEDMEKEEQDTPSMELQLPSEPTSRSASMEIVDSGSTLEHENEGEKESAVVLSPSESTPDDNLLPKKIDQLVQVKEIPPNKQKESNKTKDKKRHQRKVRRPSTPSQAQVSTPVESNASVLASESSAKATVAPAMPPAVAPDTKDLFMIRRILNTVLKRQKDTNECFDIENLKCRTLMYDAKKEDKKGQEAIQTFNDMDTELPDEQTYAAFTLWEEFGEGSTRGRIAANSLLKSLFPLEDLGNRIDTWIRPQAETMHKILHRYILCPRSTDPKEAADQAVASHAAHEFFLKVMLWHKTFSSRGNKLFALSFLRIHFDRDLKEDFSGSRHFWELLLRALDLMIQEKDCRSEIGLSLLVTLLQRDLEFWLKHVYNSSSRSSKTEGGPLIKFLFENDSNIESHFKHLCREVKPILAWTPETKFRPEAMRLIYRLFSMIGIYASCLDRDQHSGSLDRKDNLKSKISRHLANLFQSLLHCGRNPIQEFRRVKILVALVRPSWLGRNVCRDLLTLMEQQQPKSLSISQILKEPFQIQKHERQTNSVERFLTCLYVDRSLDAFSTFIVFRTLWGLCNPQAKLRNPCRYMNRLVTQENPSSLETELKLDNRLVVRRANFLSGVNELIDAAMEVQDAFKKISLEQNSENGTANESEEEDPVHTMAKLKLGCLFEY